MAASWQQECSDKWRGFAIEEYVVDVSVFGKMHNADDHSCIAWPFKVPRSVVDLRAFYADMPKPACAGVSLRDGVCGDQATRSTSARNGESATKEMGN